MQGGGLSPQHSIRQERNITVKKSCDDIRYIHRLIFFKAQVFIIILNVAVSLRAARIILERSRSKSYDLKKHFTRHLGT